MGTAEIEIKAHVNSPDGCKKNLDAIAGEGTSFSKDDSYWFADECKGLPSGLRVRQEKTEDTTRSLITWKNKKKLDGLELNDEHEFEISGGAEFEELLILLGLKKKIIKHKKGWFWHYEGITAELCELSGSVKQECRKNLGWFLELEILAKEHSADTVEAARNRLLAVLEKAGLGKEHIESRYYSELLAK